MLNISRTQADQLVILANLTQQIANGNFGDLNKLCLEMIVEPLLTIRKIDWLEYGQEKQQFGIVLRGTTRMHNDAYYSIYFKDGQLWIAAA